MVQTLFADNVPFWNEREVAPPAGAGENAPLPQPLYVTAGVLATTRPVGNKSEK